MTSQNSAIQQDSSLVFIAPFSGEVYPLEQVPDPVFAQKMVGEGIAIEPTSNTLYAPCEGVVSHIHKSKHAIRISSPTGIELLIHVGLDTVKLRGEGFEPKVAEGDSVVAGQVLLEFDADLVATKARSLMTEIIVTNPELVAEFLPASGKVVAGVDSCLNIKLAQAGESKEIDYSHEAWQLSEPVVLKNQLGIHARPAAFLSVIAKKYQAEIEVRIEERSTDACSVVGLMGINSKMGDEIVIAARGDDAVAAIEACRSAIEEGLGEPVDAIPTQVEEVKETPLLLSEAPSEADVKGVGASPGLAVGKLYLLNTEDFEFDHLSKVPDEEESRLQTAVSLVEKNLKQQVAEADSHQAEIFAAHLELLSDPAMGKAAQQEISQGKTAEFAWQTALEQQIEILEKLDNPLLVQRAADLKDIRSRVLAELTQTKMGVDAMHEGAILVVDDLTPSLTAELNKEKVAGIISLQGGATSHAAILARAAGVPYVAGITQGFELLAPDTLVLLDGDKGLIELNPDQETLKSIREKQAQQEQNKARALQEKDQPAITLDEKQIEVVGNIANEADAAQCIEFGGEGVGLLRSEFLFQDRLNAPDEEEQFNTYCAIQKALKGQPLIVRTLDVGGDKPLTYLPLPKEENPFLGERGIRVSLARPSYFRTQIRAILRANALSLVADELCPRGKVRIMFPMVSVLEEVRVAKKVVAEEAQKLNLPMCEVGIMVEVPSTAAMASQFAKEVDFFSIGSNDLAQYTMAIDRGHPKLAGQADGLNPGILQLIKMTAEGAHAHGKWVGVCGGIASEAAAVPILIGLGIDELSVSIPSLPEVKAQIRSLNMAQCEQLAQQALQLDSAADVRQLTQELPQNEIK